MKLFFNECGKEFGFSGDTLTHINILQFACDFYVVDVNYIILSTET